MIPNNRHIREVNPPEAWVADSLEKIVFLAGSIEGGKAEHWQGLAIQQIYSPPREALVTSAHILFLNPRRIQWNNSWKQDLSDANFTGQVNWELDGIELADLVAFYFDPATKSPISLLELGLTTMIPSMIRPTVGVPSFKKKKVVVCCPKGFWRKGNIDVVCGRYGIEQVPTFDDLTEAIVRLTK